MKAKKLLFYLLAALLGGCIPVMSLHPLFTEKNLVFEEKLLGVWVQDTNDTIWEFSRLNEPEKAGGNAYKLVFSDKDGKKGLFVFHLVNLEDKLFFDVYPSELPWEPNDPNKVEWPYNTLFLIPVHTFIKIDSIDPRLKLQLTDDDKMEELFKEDPNAVEHALIEDHPLLTASTKQLQAFVLKYADDERVFSGEIVLSRKGAESPGGQDPNDGKLLAPSERKEVEDDVTKAVKNFVEPIAILEKAGKYKKSERFEDAEKLYLSVIDAHPSQPFLSTRAYVGLAEIYVAMEKPEKAEAAAEKAVELGGLVSGEYWALGECYEKLGDMAKTEEAFLEAIALQPEGTLYSLLGQFYGNHGQHLKAETAYKRGLELEPTNGSFHLLLASYYLRNNKHTDAITAYENAIKYADSNKVKGEIFNNIGTIYKSIYKFEKSAEAFEKALSLATDPDDIGMVCRNMAWLAISFTLSGDIDGALRLCDIALKNDPQNVVALRSKAYSLSQRQEYGDAHKLLDEALKIHSDESETFIVLAHVYLDEGQADKALQAAKRAVQLSKGQYPWSQSTLGEVYVRTGQHEEAVELLAPLIEGDLTFADIDYWYGQALAHSGQPEDGVKFVKRAASKLPFVVEYKRGLEAIQEQ